MEAIEQRDEAPAEPSAPTRLPGALVAAFALSGVAGLVYELVWTRYLSLLVGHAAYAQVLVLAVYLGGTAVGSFLIADRARGIGRPLRAYALVEAALGGLGFAFHGLYLLGQAMLYGTLAPMFEGGTALGVASWATAILLILPQSILLGTTFPLMTAGLLRRAPGVPGRSVADVYLLNTLGGAVGILLAGFALVPTVGLPGAAVTAGVLNLAAALLARRGDAPALISAAASPAGHADASAATVARGRPHRLLGFLLGATLVSALASFLYEIGWIRMLSLLLGSATHAFELMLSAFLLGLAAGSLLVRRLADRTLRPLRTLGNVQWLMGLAALLTLPIYQACFPLMGALVTSLRGAENGYFLFNVARYAIAVVVMLPATLFAGMTLPLVAATLLRGGEGERVLGLANGANTIGSVIGAVAGGLFMLPGLGLEGTLALGAGLDMAVGVAVLGVAAASASRVAAVRTTLVAGAAAAAIVFAVTSVVRLDRALLTSGVYRTGVLPPEGAADIVFYEDGATATVSVRRSPSGFTTLDTNGKPDASLPARWMQRAAGVSVARAPISGSDESTQIYAPLLLLAHNPAARNAAVIGHGSGMSAQMLLGSARLERLVNIEIEPSIVIASQHFLPANRKPFDDPRSRFLLDDARTALAGAGEPFDLIFSEPSNPWVSGVASLFTTQFYERVHARLADGGVFGQWVHVYEMEDELLLTVLAAIDRVFPDWSAWMISRGDVLIMAGKGPLPPPDWTIVDEPGIAAELALAPAPTAPQLESLRIFDASAFGPLVERWPANSDFRPELDTRAERARFRGRIAEGILEFAEHPLDLPRILARRPLAPVPFDSLPVTDLPPLARRALAGWLVTRGAARDPSPDPEWLQVLLRESVFGTRLLAAPPVSDWIAWTRSFAEVELARHGRSAGWMDAGLYATTERFLDEKAAPDQVRATVALFKHLRLFEFEAAAEAADRLGATSGRTTALPDDLVLELAVAAFLGADRPADARAAFDALAPRSGRAGDDARLLWLAALVGAEVR